MITAVILDVSGRGRRQSIVHVTNKEASACGSRLQARCRCSLCVMCVRDRIVSGKCAVSAISIVPCRESRLEKKVIPTEGDLYNG